MLHEAEIKSPTPLNLCLGDSPVRDATAQSGRLGVDSKREERYFLPVGSQSISWCLATLPVRSPRGRESALGRPAIRGPFGFLRSIGHNETNRILDWKTCCRLLPPFQLPFLFPVPSFPPLPPLRLAANGAHFVRAGADGSYGPGFHDGSVTCVEVRYDRKWAVPHVVVGSGPAGGSWQDMSQGLVTLSPGYWMELPGMRLKDYLSEVKVVRAHGQRQGWVAFPAREVCCFSWAPIQTVSSRATILLSCPSEVPGLLASPCLLGPRGSVSQKNATRGANTHVDHKKTFLRTPKCHLPPVNKAVNVHVT